MQNYKYISKIEAKKIMDTESDIVILDVRTNDEYEESHIYDSICIPVEVIDKEILKEVTDKNKKILVYCRSGKRSCDATVKLTEMGYKNVYDFGGIIDWPFDIVI